VGFNTSAGTYNESMTLQLNNDGSGGSSGIFHFDTYPTQSSFIFITPKQLDLTTPVVYIPNNTAPSSISLSQTSGIGLVNPTNQTGLSYTGLTTGLNTGGSCNVNAVGTMDATNKGVGFTSNPQLTLNNTNTTVGSTIGVPSMEFYKSGRNGSTSDIVAQLNFFGKDASGSKVQFGGIETLITSAGGGGGVDGAMDFYTCVNGTKSQVFRLNGADNENNSFRPLDMNGQPIRTSSGNLTIEASTSTGTGNISTFSKGSTTLVSRTSINLSSQFGNTTSTINAIDLGSADVLTIRNGNEANLLPENRIVMTCNHSTTTNNQIELIVNDDNTPEISYLRFGFNGSEFSLNQSDTAATDTVNVWSIPAGKTTPITLYRSIIFGSGVVSSGQTGIYEKSFINSTPFGTITLTDPFRFGTTILTPTSTLNADIPTPMVVGYWWAVCNKSTTQAITLQLNGVTQVVIPASTTPTGNTIRVGADTTTSLYLI
jgi:hypothetical protein